MSSMVHFETDRGPIEGCELGDMVILGAAAVEYDRQLHPEDYNERGMPLPTRQVGRKCIEGALNNPDDQALGSVA